MEGKPRILVVDDDLFVRRPLESILRQGGFEAVTAANGIECLQMLERELPDLILLDVIMPGARRLRNLQDDQGRSPLCGDPGDPDVGPSPA